MKQRLKDDWNDEVHVGVAIFLFIAALTTGIAIATSIIAAITEPRYSWHNGFLIAIVVFGSIAVLSGTKGLLLYQKTKKRPDNNIWVVGPSFFPLNRR